ncbi:hypothetical protein GOZ83_28590 [Agrobacterium vitis]|uniref:hypothetical protein n=1 Tax=Rhizobium/Agrobacterium group TaxID=227290 RepID=UPI0012E8FD08|nr:MULTISPECIES: hypothetical protein [Rhizobium/Agrobacterium group]MCF1496265.1 hypothetical protein [Allorhizobium ampelinum]MVA48968.1 hypothetical protein [Agrobacterium vitis]
MSDIIVVLGMHRTGTSSVAGTLVKLGGGAPQHLMPTSAFNERGYFESNVIAQFNDEILASAGTRWDDWREFNPDWYNSTVARSFQARAREVFNEEFDTALLPVVKDPRICRFFPFWRQVFEGMGKTVHVVMPLRSPWDTAKSLNYRNQMHMTHVIMLWLRHVLDAEAETRDLPRAIFSWQDFLGDWRGTCAAISAETGLTWPRLSDRSIAEVEHFLSRDLQHHDSEEKTFPQLRQVNHWAMEAYEALKELSASPQSKTARTTLTTVREAFNNSAAIFGRLLIEYEITVEERNRTLEAAVREREALQKAQNESESHYINKLNELHGALDHASHERQRLEADLEATRQSVTTLAIERDALQQASSQHIDHIRELETTLEHANQDQKRVDVELSGAQAECQQLMLRVHVLLDEIQSANKACSELHADRAQKDDELMRREAQLSALQKELANEEARASALQHDLANREARTNVLQEELANQETRANKLQEELTNEEARASVLQDELASRDAQTRALREELSDRDGQNTRMQEELINIQSALAASRKRLRQSLFDKLDTFGADKRLSRKLLASGLFDFDFYCNQLKGSRLTAPPVPIDAALHFVRNGFTQGLRPNEYFDTHWYLANNEDVRNSGINPLWHYHINGWKEGRDPAREFSTALYLAAYRDIQAANVNPLQHFLRYGRSEGREVFKSC